MAVQGPNRVVHYVKPIVDKKNNNKIKIIQPINPFGTKGKTLCRSVEFIWYGGFQA